MDFLLPKKSPEGKQLVGFQLSLPMGYVHSAPHLCIVTETVADLVNASMDIRHTAPLHTLDHPRYNRRQAVGVHPSREASARLSPGRCLPGQVHLGLPRRPLGADTDSSPHFLRDRNSLLDQQCHKLSSKGINIRGEAPPGGHHLVNK